MFWMVAIKLANIGRDCVQASNESNGQQNARAKGLEQRKPQDHRDAAVGKWVKCGDQHARVFEITRLNYTCRSLRLRCSFVNKPSPAYS